MNLFGTPRKGDTVKLETTYDYFSELDNLYGTVSEITSAATFVRVKLDMNSASRAAILKFIYSVQLKTIPTAPKIIQDIMDFYIWIHVKYIKVIARFYEGDRCDEWITKMFAQHKATAKNQPYSIKLCKPDNIKSSWKDCEWKPSHLR